MKQRIKDAVLSLFGDGAENVYFTDTLRGVSVFFFDIKAVDVALLKTKRYLTFSHGDAGPVLFQDALIVADCQERFRQEYETCKALRAQADKDAAEPFGCCNDFLRCSDARQCLHRDDNFYHGCMYRKNLENGRIFYGDNRNV